MGEATDLWRKLEQGGLTSGPPPEPAVGSVDPWFHKILMGVSGWIASLFLISAAVSLAVLLSDGSSAVLTGIGVLLCLWAAITLREESRPLFMEQASYAGSLAGQVCILMGLSVAGLEPTQLGLAAGALGAVLFAAVPPLIHRVWSAALAAAGPLAALPAGLLGGHLGPLLITAAAAWLWLSELDDGRTAVPKVAAGYGFLLALSLPLIAVGLPEWGSWNERPTGLGAHLPMHPGFALLVLVVGYLIVTRIVRPGLPAGERWLAGTGVAVVAGLALVAPGIAPFLLAVLMGFAHANRVLTGIGVVLLVLYAWRFYYDLHVTLLTKSGLLVAVGLALLGVRAGLHRLDGARQGRSVHA
ncbi:MAG: DUF4401 domain-containing protein [Thiohalorhabdus sp.]